MNKRGREVQRSQEDQALMHGMLWVAGAMVLEGLLFVLNRYAFNYDTTVEGVALATTMRSLLNILRVVGLVGFLGGGVLSLLQLKKGAKTAWAGAVCMIGFALMLCGHVAYTYQEAGMRMLYLLVPVLGGLILCACIYPREFVLCAVPAAVGMIGLWFARMDGLCLEVILSVLACVVMLCGMLMLKKNGGKLALAGMELPLGDEKTGYAVPLASVAVAVAAQVLAVVAGGGVAYYLVFAMCAWLFALLVYYTVKML